MGHARTPAFVSTQLPGSSAARSAAPASPRPPARLEERHPSEVPPPARVPRDEGARTEAGASGARRSAGGDAPEASTQRRHGPSPRSGRRNRRPGCEPFASIPRVCLRGSPLPSTSAPFPRSLATFPPGMSETPPGIATFPLRESAVPLLPGQFPEGKGHVRARESRLTPAEVGVPGLPRRIVAPAVVDPSPGTPIAPAASRPFRSGSPSYLGKLGFAAGGRRRRRGPRRALRAGRAAALRVWLSALMASPATWVGSVSPRERWWPPLAPRPGRRRRSALLGRVAHSLARVRRCARALRILPLPGLPSKRVCPPRYTARVPPERRPAGRERGHACD